MTSFTVSTADGAAATGSYSTYTGDNVEFYFNSGTWDTEITFQITAPDGSSVGSYGPYPTNSGNSYSVWTGVSNSTCAPPACLDPGSNPVGVTIQKPYKPDSYLFFTRLVVKVVFNKWVGCCRPFNNESTKL